MNIKQRQAAAMMALLCTVGLQAQVVNNAGGDYRLTLNTGNNAPRSFTIGSAFSPVGFMSALTVRGDQMGGTSVTPEVFRTNAPTTGSTFWRMFQGGTTAGFERGQLFADPSATHFNINAPNGQLQLHTQNVQRARLSGNLTGPMGAGDPFPNVNRDGYLLLSGVPAAFTDPTSRAPFTRLHLVDQEIPGGPNNYAQQQGFRPWQRNGITLTGNNDQSYIGHKYNGTDITDLVVQWSDNPNNTFGTDRMKFVFTTLYNPAASRGAATMDGLEAIRLWPATYEEVNVGIGDFAPPAVGDPTERLDILDGRVRIRQLPDDAAANGAFRLMVVDDTPAPSAERGVVKWADLSALMGCDWVVQPGQPHVSNTYNGSTCAWDRRHGVGIGLPYPKMKLHVFHTDNTLLEEVAIMGSSRFAMENMEEVVGVVGEARSPTQEVSNMSAIGVLGDAEAAYTATGVEGRARMDGFTGGTADVLTGVYGNAYAIGNAVACIGVMGRAGGASVVDFAGFFAGDVQAGGMFIPSDQNLKSEIASADAAVQQDVLGALALHTYQYNNAAFPSMHLPQGPQLGLLAQELEAMLPGLVKDAIMPAERDSAGNVIHEAVEFKSVNYVALVPYLIAGHQAQGQKIQQLQEMVAAQGAQLAQMQEMLAACCATAPTDSDQRMLLESGGLLFGKDRALVIKPNPFSEPPTVLYTLERAGRMQLIANSADGKRLSVLREAVQEAGEYQLVWDTSTLQPGMYYLTLLLDGEPVVKKAVKVGR